MDLNPLCSLRSFAARVSLDLAAKERRERKGRMERRDAWDSLGAGAPGNPLRSSRLQLLIFVLCLLS